MRHDVPGQVEEGLGLGLDGDRRRGPSLRKITARLLHRLDRGHSAIVRIGKRHCRIAGQAAGPGADILKRQGGDAIAHACVAALDRQPQVRAGAGGLRCRGQGRDRAAATLDDRPARLIVRPQSAQGPAFLAIAAGGPPFQPLPGVTGAAGRDGAGQDIVAPVIRNPRRLRVRIGHGDDLAAFAGVADGGGGRAGRRLHRGRGRGRRLLRTGGHGHPETRHQRNGVPAHGRPL
ncbi:hypothetical protein D3C80_1197310 [compost metagenome]